MEPGFFVGKIRPKRGICPYLYQNRRRRALLDGLEGGGWALSDIMEAEVTSVAAWQMAIRNRLVNELLLFHSDQGTQYACQQFREQWEGVSVRQSMSRKSNCRDNAVAKSFLNR